jgi:antitoxin YefM
MATNTAMTCVETARFGPATLGRTVDPWYQKLAPMWYRKPVRDSGGLNVAISASEARSRLFPLIQQVNDDHEPVRINSKAGDAVLMSADDYDSWQETIYLLRSPANARRLMEAVARDKSHQAAVVQTMEDLQALAGE